MTLCAIGTTQPLGRFRGGPGLASDEDRLAAELRGPEARDHGWIDDLPAQAAQRLRRPTQPPGARALLASERIDRTILAQAAPTEAGAECRLSLADRHTFISDAVVWREPEAPDFERRLGAPHDRAKVVGMRPLIHDIPDPTWLLRPTVRPWPAEIRGTS